MSWPAGILARAMWYQVATGSAQASTWKVQSPGASALTQASQRSRPAPTSRIGCQPSPTPSGPVSTTFAATASCPSRKTVADTGNNSPATAFAGLVPPRTEGLTSSRGIRPITHHFYPLSPSQTTQTAERGYLVRCSRHP